MGENDLIILGSIINQSRQQMEEPISDSEYFEIFTFDQVLKQYELSYDEISSGNIDSGDDGGIDGFFTFINGDLLDEDTAIDPNIPKNPLFEMFLIQSKIAESFSEKAVQSVISTAEKVFDLSRDIQEFATLYSHKLIDKASAFRKAYVELAKLHPILKIVLVYASKGNTNTMHPKVKEYGDEFKKVIGGLFSGAQVETRFMGARELLDASRLEKSYTLQLQFLESFLSRGADNYVVLSGLSDYFKFVTDEAGNLRRYIFESNVRDYQGNVEVNRDIQNTLVSDETIDFWWLNNGITILASKASIVGKTMTLDNVQIVNGLQTTNVIHDYFKAQREGGKKDKERAILIRIIVTEDAEVRDRIIKATNFQTAIPPASLKATDRIQRDIEDYFNGHGWFYDRRKNYYKNTGKPISKIISIPVLAQAIMALVLREPDNARARPSSLIKRETDYSRVFDSAINPSVYLFCARVMKRVDSVIRGEFSTHTMQERSNLKFHAAMVLMTKLTHSKAYEATDIEQLSFEHVADELVKGCLDETILVAKQFAQQKGWTIERLAKNRDFVNYLINSITIPSAVRKQ